jgi:membrane protein
VAAASSPSDVADAPGAASSGAGRPALIPVLKRAFANFRAHEMTDHAGTLTYFAMMSLFPALLLAVTLLGLFGQQSLVTQASKYLLDHGADPATASVVSKALDRVINSSGGALGLSLVISIALALNGTSGAFAASGRALNVVYGVGEDRGVVRRKITDLATALVVIVLLLLVLVAVFTGGKIADEIFSKIGLGSTAQTVWSIARWPVALFAASVAYGLVYAFSPNVVPRRFRWISPGALLGVVLWILLSIAFGLYIQNFSSYGAAYGAFGAAIVLLLWLYLSANAFLFGGEFNAELERTERFGEGAPPAPSPPPSAADPDGTAAAREPAGGRPAGKR